MTFSSPASVSATSSPDVVPIEMPRPPKPYNVSYAAEVLVLAEVGDALPACAATDAQTGGRPSFKVRPGSLVKDVRFPVSGWRSGAGGVCCVRGRRIRR